VSLVLFCPTISLIDCEVFIGGQGIVCRPRVGRNGIQRLSIPELLAHSSSMLPRPVHHFPGSGTFGMTNRLSFTDQTLRVHQSQDLIAIDKTSNISASPALDDTSNPAPEDSRSTGITAITPTGPANITTNKLRYRALPPRDELSTRIPTTRKRKHASTLKGSRPIRYFEGSSSEDEGGGDQSGDGSSSGDSIVFEGPTKTKRQRTSGIVTRSSVRTPAPDVSNGESSESASLTPTTSTPSSTVTTSATAVVDETAPSDTTIPAQPDATNPQLTGAADTGLVGPPIAGPPHAESTITPVTGPEPVAITGTELAATVTGLTVGGSPHRVHRRVF